MRTALRAALVAGLLTTFTAAPALAAPAAPRVGWWTQASVRSPVDVSAPVGPDVPAGGMLVASGTSAASPLAYGGITFELPAGATANKLALQVASGSSALPGSQLALCALDRPDFTPAAGAPISDGPGYSCAHQVLGTLAADGTTYTFDPSRFRTLDVLAVAVVPAAVPTRVVLAPITTAALPIRLPVGDTSTVGGVAPPVTTPGEAPAAGSGLPGLVPAAPPPVTVGSPLAGPAAQPVTAVVTTPSTPVAHALPATRGGRGFHHQGLIALLLVAALLLAWTAAGASAARPLPGSAASPHDGRA